MTNHPLVHLHIILLCSIHHTHIWLQGHEAEALYYQDLINPTVSRCPLAV